MNHCPNCGNKIQADLVLCECGELLRGEVTHHADTWETETVFRTAKNIRSSYLVMTSIVLVVVALISVIGWPQIREHWKSDEAQSIADSDVTQSQAPPDSIPPSDLIQADNEFGQVTQEGVFDFTNGENTRQNAKLRNSVRPNSETRAAAKTLPASEDSYDVQLLSDNKAGKTTDEKMPSDCKLDVTVSLNRPEPVPADDGPKQQPKRNAINYILGPRGGCFFVTAGGSKKYVDHSLCGATAAAARQD